MKYTIFGVKNDLFVETTAETLAWAKHMAMQTTVAGYRARIWDNEGQSFVTWP